MIVGTEDVAELFSILHDGVIVEAAINEGELVLRVMITYLAERINEGFTTFFVRIHDVESLTFVAWPEDVTAAPEVLDQPAQIFVPELEILSGGTADDRIEVVCEQSVPHARQSGGTLSFRASSADLIDQNGRSYSLSEIAALSESYWRDWSERCRRD